MVKKKIILISSGLYVGGVERSLIALLSAFDHREYEVSLFLYSHDGEWMDRVPLAVKVLPEIPAYAAIYKPLVAAFFSRQFSIAICRLIAKTVKMLRSRFFGKQGHLLPRSVRYCQPFLPAIPGEYDLALSFLSPHDTALNKVTAAYRIGWVHTDYKAIKQELDCAFERPMWQGLDKIAAVSDEVKISFLKVFPEFSAKAAVIENMLSPEMVTRQAEAFDGFSEMPVLPGEARLCSVGRFCAAKGFDLVPEVVQGLNRLGVRVKWYLIGYGSDEALIRSRIIAFGVSDQVIILGKKTNPYPYIKACDIYVQPSRYEGKAVTVREAQILGKPVIITNFPTAQSQLEDGVDGIIAPLDIEGCVRKIKIVIEDTSLQGRLVENCLGRDYSNRAEVGKIYALAGRTVSR